jgi:lipopolysaccharide export system protein LptA
MTMRTFPRIAATAALALALGGTPAFAQGLGFGGDKPIEIVARDGIEWHRETQRYIARGDARATQGDTKVEGDVLTAFYRQIQGSGSTEIFRYEVTGNVRISTPTQRGFGEKGTFDVDSGVLVLTGKNLKITTPTEEITARDSLEYFQTRQVAVARGNAQVITTENRRINADLLSAYFVEGGQPAQTNARAPSNARPPASRPAATPAAASNSQAQKRLQRAEGFGNVIITTPMEVARGDRGVYNADTGIAMLASNVKITRADNQLNGDFAEVNTVTGISRLLNRPGQSGDERVRGLFIPQDRNKPASPSTK